VVKDDPNGLARTRDSLQNCRPDDREAVQWLVIDSSSDRSSVTDALSASTIPATIEWVPPEGVYEAMNAGLQRASGDYLYYLNAGDRLRNAQALNAILSTIEQMQSTWMYGQVAFIDAQGAETIPPPFDYNAERHANFSNGRFPPHQGTIVRREALQSFGGFDTSYRITADYTAMLRLSRIADPVELPEVLAEFTTGGLSESRWLLSINEFHRARLEILRPRGFALVAEFASTAQHALRMGLHRVIKRTQRRRLP